ncbi:alpha/beta hydrolase [Lyngbya confervoides]|uniref:Alpha/beta hydrolase n=1 Tax=Lyngbya confervoides BDU141951 TaxID=1574623 RepID=A0ABD4T4I6_9CYAN|nr:alpha/beta fold hydrolase [Lyngbya confervoides]MCM1983504.1 alpha/beta hydrolase [Lyngbya confervoides BDU141951]
MKKRRISLLLGALALIVTAWVGLAAARAGLVVRSLQDHPIPFIYLAPRQATSVPGVIVAHGFAGSKQLMLGYGYVLARAGYGVILGDFNGHGANPAPFDRDTLPQMLETARQVLLLQPEVDPSRLALLGHSMGSGLAMNQALAHPDRYQATVAISPTGAALTPQLPRNLQLQAGSGEGPFVRNAQRLLQQAGGENLNLKEGLGRELVVVPRVEHISILFSDRSHQAALNWLDRTFAILPESDQPPEGDRSYRDRRMVWYGLHLLGWILALESLSPAIAPSLEGRPRPSRRPWIGLILSPFLAAAGLWALSFVISLPDLGGIQVGGALGLWFLIAG